MDIKYIKQLQIDNLSDKLKNEQLSAGFYIKINSGYTATVRTILSLTEYINSNPKDIDLSVFGEITSFDSSASKQFIVMDKAKCVDIKYHTDKDSFRIMGFNGGSTPVPHTEVTLTTILL